MATDFSCNVYKTSDDASYQLRLALPALALKAQGCDVELCDVGGHSRQADLLVFNRPHSKKYVEIIAKLLQDGYRVVIDIDDDFSRVASTHAMAKTAPLIHGFCRWAANLASVVTVTTPALQEVYGPATVVPNHVPAAWLKASRRLHDGLWAGWSGTVTSHPDDLQVAGNGVARGLAEAGAELVYVGPKEQGKAVARALGVRRPPLVAGWQSFDTYPDAVAQFDVGLVPLADTLFNCSKSVISGLTLAAVGVPFIASPTPAYRSLHDKGAGLLARHPSDWRRQLSVLLADADYRKALAVKGRDVAAGLTIEQHAQAYWDAWSRALDVSSQSAHLPRGVSTGALGH